jgi:ABC-type uncharacterized transport system
MNLADSFRAARWIRFTNLLLQAVLFLALFGGLNYIALNHTWRFDLTKNRQHSLSAETKSYLERLERDVKIVVTLTDDGEHEDVAQAYRDITGLLREYTYATRVNSKGKIVVREVDVYQNRKEAEELGLGPNVVALICGDHRRVMPLPEFYRINMRDSKPRKESFLGESALTAGILDVSSPDKKKIYFVAGHGEMRPDDVNRTRGLSQLGLELRQRNYEIAGLDLSLVSKIPDDADHGLVIIAAPQTRFQPAEVEMLRNFLQTRAGRVILMLEPAKQHGLEELLFDWGVIVYDKLVVDLDPNSLTENNDLRLWTFVPDPVSHITDNLINNTLPVVVSPAALVVSDDLGRSANDGLNVKKLVVTSDKAWGEADYRSGARLEYTPGQDLRGHLGVMVISERTQPANNLPLSVRGGRLAVFGTADLVTNNRIFTAGNLNLFLATVDWTADRDTKLNIPARPIQRFQLSLSQEELMRLRLGLLLVIPGTIAVLGFVVYWTRRN